MTFNPNADISGNKTSRRGRNTAIVGGGGVGVIGLLVFLIGPLLGVDVTGLMGGVIDSEQSSQSSGVEEMAQCDTGEDANKSIDCRMAGAQVVLDDYWSQHVDGYEPPLLTIVDGQTSTQCGTASNAVGPFYCPPEQGVYIDPSFFEIMRQQFGASADELAQLYIVGHEWGHHIQNITGTMSDHPNNGTGAESNGVRIELQADCYAGAWLGDVTSLTDDNGTPYLQTPNQEQIDDALNAAFVVGDDHIQKQSSGSVNPESFTHGSSEQRQKWFTSGYENGLGSCDTFGEAYSG
ncbi:MAG: KPN_02809 family neutral zinc metallopeptidase [Brevibacterium aurantiacum]|uniref:Neutral zinc metallopeptidase n=1 Tax=Brevibacterium aurantiacum TaxID=273384 RepID=A0A2A3YVG6_BREAU|nr:neutral zinc metallopeptidase [Brevibacterium aurantiacum]AZL13512.1 neutral zinc metallopeptidase [Brevibacterium aurantiacum]PCC43264.1 neutral zinc metallopeptidase [Brevibacterium aurantiacum]